MSAEAGVTNLSIEQFLEQADRIPLLDVRTPAEYQQGHIPGAHNLPLFSNAERAEIGTLYKQAGRLPAIDRGLQLVGPRMGEIVAAARALCPDHRALLHCWRGGMRSAAVAWLLRFSEMEVQTLEGGYKSFRRYVLEELLPRPRPYLAIGGATGVGKTEMLGLLAARGRPSLDLEALANHRGSAFGALGQPAQPSQESFENLLAMRLRALDRQRGAGAIFVEDEGRTIGRVALPASLQQAISAAPMLLLECNPERRVERLLAEYGAFDRSQLSEAMQRIGKRLGGLALKQALQSLEAGDLTGACRVALQYYDRSYDYSLQQRARQYWTTLRLSSNLAEMLPQVESWAGAAVSEAAGKEQEP
ncbi:MAG: tRNA 2-selenouridine(34) synthase MnmH [Leptospirales bacterium]|nr:tRNA 2-selenouridine(34) synthase MnmH [Leptospirales bacterium]